MPKLLIHKLSVNTNARVFKRGARLGLASLVFAAAGLAGVIMLRQAHAAVAPTSAVAYTPQITQAQINSVFSKAEGLYDASAGTFVTGTASTGVFPSTTNKIDGSWVATSSSAWTSGFLAGDYWMLYQHNNLPIWQQRALIETQALQARSNDTTTHDVGFVLLPSYGNALDLSPGSSPTDSGSFSSVLSTGAASLSTRFNPLVQATRSWNNITSDPNYQSQNDFQVIVDNLMNLELLHKAADLSPGTSNADVWRSEAIEHALTNWTYFRRSDGSFHHLVVFDSTTGKPRTTKPYGKTQPQAYSLTSTWSRGQAWVIAGYTIAYKETGDSRFLTYAHRALQYYLANLPADSVPYWDFNVPTTPQPVRDTSAAAITASYLLELSTLETTASQKQADIANAEKMLQSLMSPTYQATSGQSVLAHATVNGATCIVNGVINYAGSKCNADTGLVYADYYLLQALNRYQALLL